MTEQRQQEWWLRDHRKLILGEASYRKFPRETFVHPADKVEKRVQECIKEEEELLKLFDRDMLLPQKLVHRNRDISLRSR